MKRLLRVKALTREWVSISVQKIPQTQQKDGVATSRRRALDAALVLDYQTTRDARFLCDRDTVPTFSHVAQSVCPQVI
jgi:hypothetical protein